MVNQASAIGGAPAMAVAGSPAPAVARVATRPSAAPAQRSSGQQADVAQVNQHLQQVEPGLQLQMDSETGRTIYKVVQQGTGEVVLQIPSEEVLGMLRRVKEMDGQTGASGALMDKEG